MKKKILYISFFLPYDDVGHAGGKTLNYYIKKIKNASNLEVKLVSFCRPDEVSRADCSKYGIDESLIVRRKDFKKFVGSIFNINSKFNPWHKNCGIITSYDEHLLKQKLSGLKRQGYEPDVIVMEWTQIVLLVDTIKKIYPRAKYIAGEHDVSFVGYERKANLAKGYRKKIWNVRYAGIKKYEMAALKKCDLIFVQNFDNKKLLIEEGLQDYKIQWLVPYFHNMKSNKRNSNGKDILFYGAMSRPENYLSAIWFIKNVLPLLEDNSIRFVVLGSNPPEELKKFENNRIHITGFVDSIDPFFESSLCLVAPLVLGAGIKVKVIEAFSAGIPVLTNDIGIEGIPAIDGRDYIYCAEPRDYEKAIRMLLNAPERGVELGNNSKKLIEERISLEDSLIKYRNKIQELR